MLKVKAIMINFTKLYQITVGNSFTKAFFAILLTICSAAFVHTHVWANQAGGVEKQGPKVIILGDSLSAGYQLAQGEGFPDKLQAVLNAKGLHAQIIGAGVSGDTTSGGLARLDWSIPQDTDAVILQLGANDSLRGIPPANTRKNLETMITRLQERGTKILLVGMLAPPNMGEDYANAYNAIFPQLAKQYDLRLYPFFLDGVLTKPEFLLADGIHPNGRGVEIMVSGILPLVEALLEELRPIP